MAVKLSAVEVRARKPPRPAANVPPETAAGPGTSRELGLAESAAMSDPHAAFSIMERLRELGAHIPSDDFGAGHTSFAYSERFRIHKIEIDQSFVREVDSREQSRAIVNSIISVSRSLGLRMAAEGVESSTR